MQDKQSQPAKPGRKRGRPRKVVPTTSAVPGDGSDPGYLDPPEMEELPEEPTEEENRPSMAAAAEKFKRYGELRRDPNAAIVPVKKRLVNLPVRNSPFRDWFVRTSCNAEHRGHLPLFWDKGGDGNAYLVAEEAQGFLSNHIHNNDCVLTITRQGSLFLWCTPLENEQGDWNTWHSTAYDMKEIAASSWIKVVGNKQLSGYEPVDPEVVMTREPTFPDNLEWSEIVHLAFRRRLIEKEEHPVLARILGRI
jgi:hypothetical protein